MDQLADNERQGPVDDDFDNDIREVPSHSPDFRTELAKELSRLAPEAVADGKIDVEKLRELLDEDSADDGRERFGLTWPGKSRALKAAQAPTTATLVPDREASKDWNATGNVFIEGDNLEVLKILQKRYHGKIKMIYIDPPYNTGNDFIYPDNYKEGLQTYLEWTNQLSREGKKLSSNPESAGRYHSNWLNLMYPRLKLARNLLSSDGFLIVSIDETEVAHLRRILDDIFGVGNLLGQVVWFYEGVNENSDQVKKTHEYILIYGRREDVEFSRHVSDINVDLPPTVENSVVKNGAANPPSAIFLPPGFPADFEAGTISASEVKSILYDHDLVVLDSKLQKGVTAKSGWSSARILQQFIDQGFKSVQDSRGQETKFVIKRSGNVHYLKDRDQSYFLSVLRNYGTTMNAAKELERLLGQRLFDYPKPLGLLKYLTDACTGREDIVLDLFSGSGTTAHAVMQLNAEDGGSRQHIQVQLPEPVGPDSEAGKLGFGTIADIARERIRRAGEKIKEEFAEQLAERETPLDVGFRSYKLADTSFVKWRESSNADQNALEARLAGLRGSADDDATPEMLLSELLLKQGYSLTETVSEVEIAGLKVWSVADGAMLAVMDEHVKPSLEQLRAVVEAGPVRLVILEDVLAGDDQLKTNLVQHAKTHSVELWSA